MNYQRFFRDRLDQLQEEGNYRVFADLERQCGAFPTARSYTENGPEKVHCMVL